MADAGIVRNLAKVRATITNARATLRLREDADGDPRGIRVEFSTRTNAAAGHDR